MGTLIAERPAHKSRGRNSRTGLPPRGCNGEAFMRPRMPAAKPNASSRSGAKRSPPSFPPEIAELLRRLTEAEAAATENYRRAERAELREQAHQYRWANSARPSKPNPSAPPKSATCRIKRRVTLRIGITSHPKDERWPLSPTGKSFFADERNIGSVDSPRNQTDRRFA
jgi:hypothetical protein